MLIKVTDSKGKAIWINPLYVRAIRSKRPGKTEILGSFTSLGSAVVTGEDADALAERVSIAMPISPAMAAVLDDGDGNGGSPGGEAGSGTNAGGIAGGIS